ncbi:thioredoxin domain-containing protein [Cellulomonas sp. P24]|uniref:thioredoxin domain-containing protein n=1 Tax=Cellulomonas sp. P24 TaxID=2885206 RepID=UPI00286FED28|nr:thioredoxin domain-containing protein [Cellulomonas sp. P24]MCR6491557.1 thioredoxin domain-containing protein [Cellulomonas sp. P24]
MSNRLARATSPYLLQHAENPVDWYEWGEEAFAEARRRDVPLLISVGYAACHWCHVMAHESFEDPATAAFMNAHVVAVKVDREERPDVDAVYMDATRAMTGGGGWPMTVFATPDGEPFYTGTYFPPHPAHGLPSFRQVLEAMHDAWTTRRDEVERSAASIRAALADRGAAADHVLLDPAAAAAPVVDRAVLHEALAAAARGYDGVRGGFGGAPKFPRRCCSSGSFGTVRRAGGRARPRRSRWPSAPSRRWPAAGSTTSSVVASRGTRSTPRGSCRTSRRCSTTTLSCCACMRTGGARPGHRSRAVSSRRRRRGSCASSAPRRAVSRRPSTPTRSSPYRHPARSGPPRQAPPPVPTARPVVRTSPVRGPSTCGTGTVSRRRSEPTTRAGRP